MDGVFIYEDKRKMEKNNELYLLIVRELTNDITEEQRAILFSKLREDLSLQKKYNALKHVWDKAEKPNDTVALNNIFNQVMGHVYEQKDRKRYKITGLLKVAVSILLLISVSLTYFLNKGNAVGETHRYTTSVGETREVILPDKSKVLLNSSSTLIVPEQFTNQNRDVVLIGEALFDVTKDRQRPFRVETSHLQVEVLGTRFFMKSYQNEKNISTILEEGSVKLKGDFSDREQYIMIPGQKAIVDKETMRMVVISNYKPKESWESGYLVFDEEKLEQIILQLERKFGMRFILVDKELNNYTYTGRFRDESVFEILGCLAVTKSFKYTLKDNTIIMSKE